MNEISFVVNLYSTALNHSNHNMHKSTSNRQTDVTIVIDDHQHVPHILSDAELQ